jgi:hypothetical protein
MLCLAKNSFTECADGDETVMNYKGKGKVVSVLK